LERDSCKGTNPTCLVEPIKSNNDDHPTEEVCRYNIRPRKEGLVFGEGLVDGGLDTLDKKKSRTNAQGRKSYISIAQDKATYKVKTGKQQSMFGALRENAPVGVNP